jgi:hypothetical protein
VSFPDWDATKNGCPPPPEHSPSSCTPTICVELGSFRKNKVFSFLISWTPELRPFVRLVGMSSREQVDANQRNGALSQGPKTPEGKAASAQNARKHGLLSQGVLLPNEDKGEFDRFAQSLHGEMDPQGELEHALVVRIVGLLWRLRRAGKLETGVLFWQRLLAEVDLEECILSTRR